MSDADFIVPAFAIAGVGLYMYYSLFREIEELEEEVLVMEDEVLELEKKLQTTHPVIEDPKGEMEPQSVWEPPPLEKKKEGVLEKLERLELMKKDGDELSRSDIAFVERVKGYIRELAMHRDLASMSPVELDEYLSAKEEEYKSIPRIKPAHVEEFDGEDDPQPQVGPK